MSEDERKWADFSWEWGGCDFSTVVRLTGW